LATVRVADAAATVPPDAVTLGKATTAIARTSRDTETRVSAAKLFSILLFGGRATALAWLEP
jgi:hypothetical protein